MDLVFVEGIAVVIAAIILFIGSPWLLLTVIMGGRLAYFVTASVALGFLFIMTLVWSYGTPLGPVGQLADWNGVALGNTSSDIEFEAASSYPDKPWAAPSEDDKEDLTKAAALESAAIDYLGAQIQEQKGQGFLAESDAQVLEDTTRLYHQGENEYGALTLEASDSALEKAKEADPDQSVTPADATAIVVMKYDPGNPLGKARMIAGGTFLLFALHLFGLSRAERKAKKELSTDEGPR